MRLFSFKWFVSGAIFVACFLPSIALAYVSPGPPQGYVNDFAHVLTSEERAQLESSVQAYESRTSREVAVVTIPSLGDETVENYAVKLFEEWGIGKRTEDNGVLLLLAIQDRKLRVEVGYGLEPILTDVKSAQLVENAVPLLKEGRYYAALDRLTTDVELVLDRGVTPTKARQSDSVYRESEEYAPRPWEVIGIFALSFLGLLLARYLFLWAIALVVFVISYLFAVITGRQRPSFHKQFAGALSLGALFSGISFGGRGGGGGSSGGGFGGGRSGGGGASGGW